MAHAEFDALWALAERDVADVDVKAHVEECEPCAKKLAEIRATQSLLPPRAELPPVPPLPAEAWMGLEARLMARVEKELAAPVRPGTRRGWWLAAPALALCAVILLVVWPARRASLEAARVVQAPGVGEALHPAESLSVVAAQDALANDAPAQARQRIGPGASVRTGRAGRLRFDFPDGSQAVLAPDTVVKVVALSPELSSLALEQGTLRVEALHRPQRELRVVAGDVEIVDVGTRFEVFREGGRVDVRVMDGEVEAKRGEEKVRLVAGQAHAFERVDERDEASPGAPTAAPASGETQRGADGKSSPGAPVVPPAPGNVQHGANGEATPRAPQMPAAPGDAQRGAGGEVSPPGAAVPPAPGNTQRGDGVSPAPGVSQPGSGSGAAPAPPEPKNRFESLRQQIRAPFAPLGSTSKDGAARDVERLADEGSCAVALERADAWLKAFAPPQRVTGRDAQLRRTVLSAKARCLHKLGREQEAAEVRAAADELGR